MTSRFDTKILDTECYFSYKPSRVPQDKAHMLSMQFLGKVFVSTLENFLPAGISSCGFEANLWCIPSETPIFLAQIETRI
jgi:hypothetical protein